MLLRLAQVSDGDGLGLASTLLERARATYGMTPAIAWALSACARRGGDWEAGQNLLIQSAARHPNEADWQVLVARFHEAMENPAASEEWQRLGDSHPDDFAVQRAVLFSTCRANDRAFWSRTIDRIKDITGEEGIEWRAERARWLLAGPRTEKDKGEAVNLLTGVVRIAGMLPEPHRLLAQAMEAVNNPSRAIEEWSAAVDARPGDPAYAMGLTRLLVVTGRVTEAVEQLDRLATNPTFRQATDGTWLADQYARAGAINKALGILQAQPPTARREAALAAYFRRDGRVEEAAAAYRRLLADSPVEERALRRATDFFGARHDDATAHQFLDRIEALARKPGEAEIVRGRYAEKWEGTDAARAHFTRATNQAAQSEATWAALTGFYLRRGERVGAQAAAERGLQAVPGSNRLSALQAHSAMLKGIANPQDLAPVLEQLADDPFDTAASRMLKAIADASADSTNSAFPSGAVAVAKTFPEDAAVQLEAAQLAMKAADFRSAVSFARCAQSADPDDPRPAAVVAEACEKLSQWDQALAAAARWRNLAADPTDADLLTARVNLEAPAHDAAKAKRLLEPYLSAALPARQKQTVADLYAWAQRPRPQAGRAAPQPKSTPG